MSQGPIQVTITDQNTDVPVKFSGAIPIKTDGAIAVTGTVTVNPDGVIKQQEQPQGWLYKVINMNNSSTPDDYENKIKEAGLQQWELVAVYAGFAFFKKPNG
ncbi:MAG: hypothetical protein JO316_09865 [Abitibacteriaceae bacterium]|nr:hypothetical protein [Abditibacteriaceae bacterium]MBV9865645.1 hypothetical protein [Abditibacteriaceae bacterium]